MYNVAMRGRYVASSGPADPLTNGLVSYYKLDEASGNALDAHGSNALTATSAPGADTGALNGARTFTGSNYFSKSSASDFDVRGTKDFMLSCWLYMPLGIINSLRGAFAIESADFNSPAVFMVNDDLASASLDINTGGKFVLISNPTISANTWFHILMWRSLADEVIGVRVNNSEEQTAVVANSYSIGGTGALTAYLGSAGIYADNFNGRIDELAFWINKTKTAAAATALYNGGTPLPYSSFSSYGF